MSGLPKIETLANIAIIAVAVILGGTLLYRVISPVQSSKAADPAPVLQAGMALPKSNIDWAANEKSLIFVLSTECKYCHESAEFYQRLTSQLKERGGVKSFAILPQSYEESTKYLGAKNILVDEVLRGDPGSLMVRGTPTLILVDRSGVALDVWVGKLSKEKEEEVMTRVFADVAQRNH